MTHMDNLFHKSSQFSLLVNQYVLLGIKYKRICPISIDAMLLRVSTKPHFPLL